MEWTLAISYINTWKFERCCSFYKW